jgi:hypothetical protein
VFNSIKSYFIYHIILYEHEISEKKSKKIININNLIGDEEFDLKKFDLKKLENWNLISYINRIRSKSIDYFTEIDGLEKILIFIDTLNSYEYYNIISVILEILNIVLIPPYLHLKFLTSKYTDTKIGAQMIFEALSGEFSEKNDIIYLSLNLLNFIVSSENKDEDQIKSISELIRRFDGIGIIIKILKQQENFDESSLVCQILLKLSKSDPTIFQILKKIDLISVLTDNLKKKVEKDDEIVYKDFKKHCLSFLQYLLGQNNIIDFEKESIDPTISRIEKFSIVSNTEIKYNESEVLDIIKEYLNKKGFKETINTLKKEEESKKLIKNEIVNKRKSLKFKSKDKKNSIKERKVSPLEQPTKIEEILTEHFKSQHKNCDNPISLIRKFCFLL